MGPRPCAVLLVVPLAFRAPRGVLLGRAAWCARGRRPSCLCCLWPHGCSGRRRARPPARSPHASLTARSGRSRSPPVPSGPSGVLHTSGVWSLCVPVGGGPPASRPRRELRSARCLEARPGPAAPAISHAIPSDVFHGLKSDRWNSADSALRRGWAELELHAELWDGLSPP